MFFPVYRSRRIRQNSALRNLVRETNVGLSDLVMPLFVTAGKKIKEPIKAMPGQFYFSIDKLLDIANDIWNLNITAVILFGIPSKKDSYGSSAYSNNGVIQAAIKVLKDRNPDLCIITDVCLCQYLDHGHCGVIENGIVDNDTTSDLIAKIALSHVEAGANMVAPSDMMDGRIFKIRKVLDKNYFQHIPIMSYAVKYCSQYYGPFREAAKSAPEFGDRSGYQMDPANSREAIREVSMDVNEGADIIMIKPALAYLDIISQVRTKFNLPIAAYNVSGEYSMIKAADSMGWIKGKEVMVETLTSIKRSGADIILTYFAIEMAKLINS